MSIFSILWVATLISFVHYEGQDKSIIFPDAYWLTEGLGKWNKKLHQTNRKVTKLTPHCPLRESDKGAGRTVAAREIEFVASSEKTGEAH